MEHHVLHANDARRFSCLALRRAGLPLAPTGGVADALVDTSLRGVDTRGQRLLALYLEELASGRSNSEPEDKVRSQCDATRACSMPTKR